MAVLHSTDQPTSSRIKNLVGKKYHRLLVLRWAGQDKHKKSYWWCRCACGKEVAVPGNSLQKEKRGTKSCGCWNAERIHGPRPDLRTHGQSKTPLYRIYCGIKSRCLNPKHVYWKDYGGAGIKICKRWLYSFENFAKDVGPRPSPKHTLDRINCYGDYEPRNIKWTTWKVQQRNRKNNIYIEYQGMTLCVAEWAERYGLRAAVVLLRLNRGWTLERSLTTPLGRSGVRDKATGRFVL